MTTPAVVGYGTWRRRRRASPKTACARSSRECGSSASTRAGARTVGTGTCPSDSEARRGEAVRARAALLVELEQNKGSGDTPGTFGELAERWYAHGKPGWKARTADSYRRHLDQVIVPALGAKDADRLRPADLDRLWASLADGQATGNEIAPATVERYAATVKAIFNFGIRPGELARNLVLQAPPPRSHPKEITPPSVEMVTRLLVVRS